jgi:phospholipid/cholesterol/gamma-HCH transport system permease protein
LPAVIVFSLIKETGPIITGLIASGRVGAGIGAELGSMRVTEQIDAMEASAVDPHKYLAATRILACIVAMPLLTIAADFCGVLMGWVATTLADPVSLRTVSFKRLSRRHIQRHSSPHLKTAFLA